MDGAAVELDDVADDRQAEPEPAVGPRGNALGLPESIEHVRKELGRDALPRIDHPDLSLALHETLAAGTILGALTTTLDLATATMSAPLPAAIGPLRLAHPAILLALANQLFVSNYELGPWIHAASEVTNFAAAHDGDTVTLCGRIAQKYERKGHEFAVLDIVVSRGDVVAQRIVHTAIWQPSARLVG